VGRAQDCQRRRGCEGPARRRRAGRAARRGAVPGAALVPLYREVQGGGLLAVVRRLVVGWVGSTATERNPGFEEGVEAAVGRGKGKDIVLVCSTGGALEATRGFPTGKPSRSLKAAALLRRRGYRRLTHVAGGAKAWPAGCD